MKQSILLSFIVVLFLTACEHKEAPIKENKTFVLSDSMRHMIEIDTVQECNVTSNLSLSGIVGFNENNVVKVFPRISGQVVEAQISLGDRVTKGQTLAIIKSADVAGNYNDLNSANADLAIAERHKDNAESLYKSGISSEREYNEAKQNYEKALAAKNKIHALITINGGGKTAEGGQYIITSPIDGYIVEKKITAGSFIRPDMGDNLFTISNIKDVWVYANVYETDISAIKEGYPVKVVALSYPDKVFIGKIDRVSQVLDPQSKAMKVRIAIDNSQMLLKPDMFAKITVNSEAGRKSKCIPKSALIPQEGKFYVVVYKNDSDLKVAQVNITESAGEKAYINSGVETGDLLIVKNQILIFSQLTQQ